MLYVDVTAPVGATVTHRVKAAGAKLASAETSAAVEAPPAKNAAPKPASHPVLAGPLKERVEKRDGGRVVDLLGELVQRDAGAFAAALDAVFDASSGVVLDHAGCEFLTYVARFYLDQLALPPERWLRVVIAATSADNNAVLDRAIARAKGAAAAAVAAARAYVEAWRKESYMESKAARLEDALDRV